MNLRDEPRKRELSRLYLFNDHKHYFEGSEHPATNNGEKDFGSSYKNLNEPALRWTHFLFSLILHVNIQTCESWVLRMYVKFLKCFFHIFVFCLKFCHWSIIPLLMVFPNSPAPCCCFCNLMLSFFAELCFLHLTSTLHKYPLPVNSASYIH